jgi:hypothetical protein
MLAQQVITVLQECCILSHVPLGSTQALLAKIQRVIACTLLPAIPLFKVQLLIRCYALLGTIVRSDHRVTLSLSVLPNTIDPNMEANLLMIAPCVWLVGIAHLDPSYLFYALLATIAVQDFRVLSRVHLEVLATPQG